MQVFGLPNQFASAEKTAAHWSQKICCKLLGLPSERTEALACRAARGLAAVAANALGVPISTRLRICSKKPMTHAQQRSALRADPKTRRNKPKWIP